MTRLSHRTFAACATLAFASIWIVLTPAFAQRGSSASHVSSGASHFGGSPSGSRRSFVANSGGSRGASSPGFGVASRSATAGVERASSNSRAASGLPAGSAIMPKTDPRSAQPTLFQAAPRHVTIGFPPRSASDSSARSLISPGGRQTIWGDGDVVWKGSTQRTAARPSKSLTVISAEGHPLPRGGLKVLGQSQNWRRRNRHGGSGSFAFFGFGYPFLGLGFALNCVPSDDWLAGLDCENLGYWGGYSMSEPQTNNAGGGDNEQESAESTISTYLPAPEAAPESRQPPAPLTMLCLRDGTTYAVRTYWLASGRLNYVASYGGQNSIDMQNVDLQATVDLNAQRGVDFTLRPGSESIPPDQQPQEPK